MHKFWEKIYPVIEFPKRGSSFVKLDRYHWISALIPLWKGSKKGRWLEACSHTWIEPLYIVASSKGYEYVQTDISPNDDKVLHTDLRIIDKKLGKFEIVVSSDTLEHIDDYKAALHSLRYYCLGRCYLHVPVKGVVNDPFKYICNSHQRLDSNSDSNLHEWNFGALELIRDCKEALFNVVGFYINCGDYIQHGGMLLIME